MSTITMGQRSNKKKKVLDRNSKPTESSTAIKKASNKANSKIEEKSLNEHLNQASIATDTTARTQIIECETLQSDIKKDLQFSLPAFLKTKFFAFTLIACVCFIVIFVLSHKKVKSKHSTESFSKVAANTSDNYEKSESSVLYDESLKLAALMQNKPILIEKKPKIKVRHKKRISRKKAKKIIPTKTHIVWQDQSNQMQNIPTSTIISSVKLLHAIHQGQTRDKIQAKLMQNFVYNNHTTIEQGTIFTGKIRSAQNNERVYIQFNQATTPDGQKHIINAQAYENQKPGLKIQSKLKQKIKKRSKNILFNSAKQALSIGTKGLSEQIINGTVDETLKDARQNKKQAPLVPAKYFQLRFNE